MTGHQALIAMRRERTVPTCVWVVDGNDSESGCWQQYPNVFDGTLHAVVQIDEHDVPEALDMRFVVGLTVHMLALRGEARAHRLLDALKAAKPKFVLATINDEVFTHG